MKFRSRLKFPFAVVALVLIISTLLTYWMGMATLGKYQFVVREQATIDLLHDFLSTLKDAETGQRGFLLSGDESYLRPYTDATARIASDFNSIRTRIDTGELKQADVNELERLSNDKLAELQRTIEMKRSGQGDVLKVVLSGHGKGIMDAIRDRVEQLVSVHQRELNAANGLTRRYAIYRTTVFAMVAFINLGFLFWAYRRIVDEQSRRESATNELAQQKNLLSVTLASIGDAVIVTDTSARITFLNDLAEQLTGWSKSDALGQPCERVFHIINEQSRQVVESPVAKVLQLGIIIGLANHTLLIRKDGSEVPIDDSGAPIRESDGTIRGVVLVFRDFSQQQASQRALIAAKEEAERANLAKDQFLAMLSHELRTPLTPVLATLTAWETSENLSTGFISDIQMVRRNVELEARLIDDLLDLTRIAKGKVSLTLEVADVSELIESVIGMFQSDILSSGIKLTMSLDARNHYVRGDSGRLQQVFWNILKNATKFTPAGGFIQIRTTNEQESLVVKFIDSGIGMDDEILQRLFQPFEQGDGEFFRRN